MNGLRAVRYGAWALVAVALVVAGWLAVTTWTRPDDAAVVTIGAPFSLTNQAGTTVTEAAFKGHPTLIFFGYTYCPDICPTALAEATSWLKELGPDGDRVGVYFVTVDPERDTQEQMASYLSAFDPRIVGLTGPADRVEEMLRAYRVYFRKVETEGGDYLMDHTSSFYLLDAKGELVGLIDQNDEKPEVLARLRRAIAEAA